MVRHALEGKSVELPDSIVFTSLVISFLIYVVGTMVFSKYERGAVKYL